MEPNQAAGGTAKYIVGLVIVVLIIIGVSFLGAKKGTPTGEDEGVLRNATVEETPAPNGAQAAINTIEVSYTNQGFFPTEVSIKVGDTVNFVNNSSEDMWVGSAMHPDHALYSGTDLKDHCPDTSGTAFDQCGKGNEYSFTFTKIGSWGYHNHSNASRFGKVIVTEK